MGPNVDVSGVWISICVLNSSFFSFFVSGCKVHLGDFLDVLKVNGEVTRFTETLLSRNIHVAGSSPNLL